MIQPVFAIEALHNWVAGVHWGVLVVLMVAAIALLTAGGNWAVSGAARLATALGISKIIVGATVVSLGTTSAELFVSVLAAIQGEGDIALGNAVGSVIADTGLVFGLCCVWTVLPKDRFILHRQGVVKLLCDTLLTISLFALAWSGGSLIGVQMPRWMGFCYVGLLIVYLGLSIRWAKEHPEIVLAEVSEKADKEKERLARQARSRRALIDLAVLVLGLGLIIAGSELMITSVMVASERLGVSQDVLAVTVVALGTSLPELVTAISAVRKGHPELMVGNVLGADILNVLFVAGVSASAVPLDVPVTFYKMHLPVMWASSLMLGAWIFIPTKTFRRWQGVPLLALYAFFVILQIVTRGDV